MQLTEMRFESGLPVSGYGPGFFRIGSDLVEGPVLLLGQALDRWAGLVDEDALLEIARQAEIVIIGTGVEMRPLSQAFQDVLDAANVMFEFMATPAACSSYNVLLSQDRRVALAAIPV